MTKKIMLAKDFALPARAVTESIAIMGRKGSGKTYTGGLLFEQMHGLGAQCVALDPVGNWWGLRLSKNGKRRGLDIPVFGGEHGDAPITPESGKLIAQVIVERRLSCVVDLMLFRKGERKRFVTAFAEEIFNLKKRQRAPLHLFLEEARKFIPQRLATEDARMVGAFEDIVRLGRNYGLGVSLIDQRPQSVNKEVLSQTELLIVHQLTGKHERKEIENWVRDKTTAGASALDRLDVLKPGEAFFWSPGLMRTFALVKVGKKTTYDGSSTPELGGEDETVETKPLSEKDLTKLKASMADVVEQAERDDPKKLRATLKKAQVSVKRLELEIENRPPATAEVIEVPVIGTKELTKIISYGLQLGEIVQPILDKMADISADIKRLEIAAGKASTSPKDKKSAKSFGMARNQAPNRVQNKTRNGSLGSKPNTAKPLPALCGDLDLNGPEQRILDSTAWLEGIGVESPEVNAVAFLAGYRPNGGAFNNPRGRLRSRGLIDYVPGKRMRLTDVGQSRANSPDVPLDSAELQRVVLSKLGGPEGRILQPLLDAYPDSMTKDDLAAAAGYSGGGGAYNNPRGRLRTLGLIDYPDRGQVRACDFLFLD